MTRIETMAMGYKALGNGATKSASKEYDALGVDFVATAPCDVGLRSAATWTSDVAAIV